MAKNAFSDKRCPKCGFKIDLAGTCRKCGRAWSESLDEGETATGLEEGQRYDSVVKKTDKPRPGKAPIPEFQQWGIKTGDDETEISRKRSLMRLESRRIYSAMGLSVRAQETQKAAFLWLSRLQEFLDEEEQRALAPTLGHLKAAFGLLTMVRNAKVAKAVRMEKALEKAHADARKVRLAAMAKPKRAKVTAPGQDSEGLGLTPVAIDPQLLLEQAKEKLLALDKARAKAPLKGGE